MERKTPKTSLRETTWKNLVSQVKIFYEMEKTECKEEPGTMKFNSKQIEVEIHQNVARKGPSINQQK